VRDCINPGGHEWTDQQWVEYEYATWNEGWWSTSPVTHFHDQTSQTVWCTHCGEVGYLIKSV